MRFGEDTEIQWRVTWFPPDHPDRSYTGPEREVHRTADRVAEYSPIIERREVATTPWHIVDNYAERGRS